MSPTASSPDEKVNVWAATEECANSLTAQLDIQYIYYPCATFN